ncbi:MAG: hypothetical protein JWO49_2540 [Arthrobacter sp.]|nr:hypothetical protein [Arthrobacter sp.]
MISLSIASGIAEVVLNAPVAPPATVAPMARVLASSSAAGMALLNSPRATASVPLISSAV